MQVIIRSFFCVFTVFLLGFNWGNAQTQLHFEDFDGVTLPNIPTGWFASDAVVTSDQAPSGAGKKYNLRAPDCSPQGADRFFGVSGISTVGKGDIEISFMHRRSDAFKLVVNLEWSTDGSAWQNSESYNTTNITAGKWNPKTINLPKGAEDQPNLWIRWRYVNSSSSTCASNSPNYRIDDFNVTYGSTLPVELSFFTAKKQDKTIELRWQTQSEINADYFQVEHSVNGTDFRALALVPAAGYSNTALDYQFTHEMPTESINYYRLNQFDYNGANAYSRVLSVAMNKAGAILLYPTVASNFVHLQFDGVTTEDMELKILDFMGKLYKTVYVEPGHSEFRLNIHDLRSGSYLLGIQSGRSFESLRFVRQ